MSDSKFPEAKINWLGFTVPELAIGIGVSAILFLGFMVALTSYFELITKNNASIEMAATSQNLLRTTVENIRTGDGVRVSNTITDPNAPAGGWNTSNTNFVIVIATPALNSSHSYIIDPSTGSPFMNELVYYKSGTTLMERILANPGAAGNSSKTTCPVNLASATCPADKTLAGYVQSMVFALYDQDAASTADPAQARSIKINLGMQRNSFGTPIVMNDSIRVTLRNRF